MEAKNKKCSSKEHIEIQAICFCPKWNIYMCNKCKNYHYLLFEAHNSYDLNEEYNNETFINFCRLKNHQEIFKFFCKNHNQLCCASCVSKFQNNEFGQHSNCNICLIKDIKEEKKSQLKGNISLWEEVSKNINESIHKLKIILEKRNNNKEELKIKIQKLFTKIRNVINDREEELLLEIEQKFEKYYLNDEIIKQSEKLPNKIKISLEKIEKLDKEWNDDNKLNYFINDCLNIENNIKEIKDINKNIEKYQNIKDFKIIFMPENDDKIDKILESLKSLGNIFYNDISNGFNISKIIDKKEYIESIKNWINSNANITVKLLYRLTDNGEKVSKFHELCDNKGPTLTLFHVEDGNKVGIYTPLSWESKTINKTNMETFIFNLNKNKKFKQFSGASICCDAEYGPHANCFGYYKIENMKKIKIYGNFINSVFEKGSDILPNNGEEKYYNLIEVEVFEIYIK